MQQSNRSIAFTITGTQFSNATTQVGNARAFLSNFKLVGDVRLVLTQSSEATSTNSTSVTPSLPITKHGRSGGHMSSNQVKKLVLVVPFVGQVATLGMGRLVANIIAFLQNIKK